MELDIESLRRRFDSLTDEALLEIDRDELVEVARMYYDAEVSRRGLSKSAGEPPPSEEPARLDPDFEHIEDPVILAYLNPVEAVIVRDLLRSAGIPAKLDTDLPHSRNYTGSVAGEVGIAVSSRHEQEAREILAAECTDAESEDEFEGFEDDSEPE